MRVGVDPNWYPINFGPQVAYVNGYTEDLLLEMARYGGIAFELIPANWDTLLDGLQGKKYDAILTSMPPYEYNVAKYDFSKNFLDLGAVLIVPTASKQDDLSQMEGHRVGIIVNDAAALILERYSSVLVSTYSSIPDLLDALAAGEIQGAVLPRIPAIHFVADLYQGKIKVVGAPMTDLGLHLVAPKGRGKEFCKILETLRKRKVLDPLLKKWSLS